MLPWARWRPRSSLIQGSLATSPSCSISALDARTPRGSSCVNGSAAAQRHRAKLPDGSGLPGTYSRACVRVRRPTLGPSPPGQLQRVVTYVPVWFTSSRRTPGWLASLRHRRFVWIEQTIGYLSRSSPILASFEIPNSLMMSNSR